MDLGLGGDAEADLRALYWLIRPEKLAACDFSACDSSGAAFTRQCA